ncbi:hypothetical protein [Paenibacillus sp. Leaf72]|uniref:hypothetical protein n=1 Tax=Paenibacillus sp. Leaf72 TaxID=1736234 RepID=UPI0006F87482|nr:hypothetical protein [Paenibacillus sp. Leaf72]KQO10646.1 hypothetical protein ASF12_09590 [Paenibacillus sp. Leaf72]
MVESMWKMTGWLAKTVAAGIIISFLSIWTTGYIVSSYLDTILKQYNLPLEVKPMALTGLWGKMWGADPLMADTGGSKGQSGASQTGKDSSGASSGSSAEQGETGAQKPDGSISSGEDAAAGEDSPLAIDAFGQQAEPPLTDIGIGGGTKADSGAASGIGAGSTESGTEGSTTNGDAEAVDGEQPLAESESGTGSSSIDGTETAVTTDQLNQVKSQMSDTDKTELFGLLMTKLPQEAWQTISGYMENGLTDEELTQLQQVIAQHLSKEEYEQIMSILKKY